MYPLNVLSTNNKNYKKFKLEDGNLYMNNIRVGTDDFFYGRNLEISNNLIKLKDNIDILFFV